MLLGTILAVTSTRTLQPAPPPARGQVSEAAAEPLPPVASYLQTRLNPFLVQLKVDRWHAEGFRGQGIKVAILDTGFHGYRRYLGKALPARVTVHSFRKDENLEAHNSQHGILCGEVIHSLAPEAELLFANWEEDRPEQFLKAVQWARMQGARVISCSVIEPEWSDGAGGGPVHLELERLLGTGRAAADLLFFASAGNTARRHWSGLFRDDGRGFHEWQPGQTGNRLIPLKGSKIVTVELYGLTKAEYELQVVDRASGKEVGRARAVPEEENPSATVQFPREAEHSYAVRVRHLRGEAGQFHLVAMGAHLEAATAQGSIPFPGDGAEVLAVGAVDSAGLRLRYSSCGSKTPSPKPDLVAMVPFPSAWRTKPFTGTSAAAPQAAALAALFWSRHPDWTAAKVRASLLESALDLGPPGCDCETGHGMIRLP
ncbi:MAG: S8 family serine peptidase [Planctomycetes bacterium]|nr:S8 family serine peptidase [Planctomycetota bacterium]